ncbi:MAG: MFS transporter [Gemmatimonadetes bacterium]|nr:MFS transporter [Gemmatimonadota bacterium]MBK7350446.1 MFS transporter [Gemmatimonadota bacterium]MBK7785589.1 MFS transporter [Gemmatimonadota bacterium]
MNPSRALPGEFKQLSVLIGVNLVDMIGLMLVLPILPFFASDLGATPERIGWLIAAFSIAQLIAAPFWGRLSDRYGRRPALVIGLLASAIAYVVFAYSTSIWMLFLSRLVQGAGGGTTGVAQAYVADTVKPKDRAKALGWLSASTNVGVTLGPVIGGLATHLDRSAPGLIAAALCLVNAWFAWRWLPETRPTAERLANLSKKPVWHAAWVVLRHPTRTVPRFVWIYGIGMLAFSALTSLIALFLKEEHGITEVTIGYFFTYIGVLNIVMRLVLLGPVVERVGETRAMRFGAAFLIAGMLAYPVAGNLWVLVALMPLVPVGTALLFPATTSLMSRYSDKAEVGTTMGVAQTYAGLARVAAPIVGTIVFQRIGHQWPFIVAAIMMALVSVLAFQVEQLPSPPTGETPVPAAREAK